MNKLSKLYGEIIDEDYPSSFNMENFKSLFSFNQRVKYCENNLKRISSGSGRIVYMVDNEKVLKLAKNSKGVAQCEVEIEYRQYHDIADVVARTFDAHPESLWVEMELAKKLTVSDFKRIVGFNFNEFADAIKYYAHVSNGRGYNQNKQPENYEKMWENEFIYDIFSFIGNYGLKNVGDLTRFNSYGVVKRDNEDTIVVIDYGLTDDVYDSYYS